MSAAMSNGTDAKMAKPDLVDAAKRRAAFYCGEQHVTNGCLLGVGSGSTIRHLIDYLKERVSDGKLKDIVCVPTSFMVGFFPFFCFFRCLQSFGIPVVFML